MPVLLESCESYVLNKRGEEWERYPRTFRWTLEKYEDETLDETGVMEREEEEPKENIGYEIMREELKKALGRLKNNNKAQGVGSLKAEPVKEKCIWLKKDFFISTECL